VIEKNQVVAEIVTKGPGDGACCPTLKVLATYALQDGALAEVGSEELGKISAADLNGTTWTLVDLNFDQSRPWPTPRSRSVFRMGRSAAPAAATATTAASPWPRKIRLG
jgi:hypothetical protein